MTFRTLVAACIAVAVLVAGTGTALAKRCIVRGVGETIDEAWQPDMSAANRYANSRSGDIAFAVRTDHRFYGYRPDHVVWSASVVKAMLMVAYLDMQSVRDRPLNGGDYSLLDPMITMSDNNAASRVRDIVGSGRVEGVARMVGMSQFSFGTPWGLSQITASDQTKLFLHIDSFIASRHAPYALHLLSSITPSQRWGIGEVQPKGWELYFKGGWGSGTGAVDHQVALLKRGCARVSVAVLTLNDGTHGYGKETLKGLFARLLKKLPYRGHERRSSVQQLKR